MVVAYLVIKNYPYITMGWWTLLRYNYITRFVTMVLQSHATPFSSSFSHILALPSQLSLITKVYMFFYKCWCECFNPNLNQTTRIAYKDILVIFLLLLRVFAHSKDILSFWWFQIYLGGFGVNFDYFGHFRSIFYIFWDVGVILLFWGVGTIFN